MADELTMEFFLETNFEDWMNLRFSVRLQNLVSLSDRVLDFDLPESIILGIYFS